MLAKLAIYPSSLRGDVSIPPSKSQTMRALIFSLLAHGKSTLRRLLPSPDTQAMVVACKLLGAQMNYFEDRLEIIGGLRQPHDVIDAGNSGQVFRFIGALCGLLPAYSVITGDASLKYNRPVTQLLDGLRQLGVWAEPAVPGYHAPILIRGPWGGGRCEIDGRDSQPISALLMASAFAPQGSHISVTNPGELPWVRLTLSWLDRFGIPYQNHDFQQYIVPGGAAIDGFTYKVPGDWSSALYPIAAALVTSSEITVTGVDVDDPQGDKEVVTLWERLGAHLSVNRELQTVTVHRSLPLKGGTIDVGPFVDAITVLAVMGCFAQDSTRIVGGLSARTKECDRIRAMTTELRKMGAEIEETLDGMIVHPSPLKGGVVSCHNDHRVALALSVAALGAKGKTELWGADAVIKSFPKYFAALARMGGNIH